MDKKLPSDRDPFSISVDEQNAVAAVMEFRALARAEGEVNSASKLAIAAHDSCLRAGKPEDGSLEHIEDMARHSWMLQAAKFDFCLDVACVIGPLALDRLKECPAMILQEIQGISKIGRRLDDDESITLANALVCFSAICHSMERKGVGVDLAALAPLACEWLIPSNGKINLCDWLSNQFAWDSGALQQLFNESTTLRSSSKPIPQAGPWDMRPAWIAALEARTLDESISPGVKSKLRSTGL